MLKYKILVLLGMMFCHIVDDFYLQPGLLSYLKQKDWWKDKAPDALYKHDYIVALFMHSFSWAFSIMFIPTLYILINGGSLHLITFIGNVVLHMVVDDAKANKKKLNLVQDQILHMFQIIFTWVSMMF